jgi:hypothetical protein
MDETRQSLLLRAQTGETKAWKDLTGLYRPLILAWLNRQGVPARDLEDLSQEVLLSVVKNRHSSLISTGFPSCIRRPGVPASHLPGAGLAPPASPARRLR